MKHIVEESGGYYARASINLGSSTVSRVSEEPDPNFKPRPVGFTADPTPVDVEPLLWDGDGG